MKKSLLISLLALYENVHAIQNLDTKEKVSCIDTFIPT